MAVSESTNSDKPKQLDREVRGMVTALTNRLSLLQPPHKSSPSHREDRDKDEEELEDNEGSIRIITLAGTNAGATMRGGDGELNEKANTTPQSHRSGVGENDALATYINSNFQATNNSIMLGGSYSTNDPGVHVDITDDFVDRHLKGDKPDKHAKKKGKKKDKKKDKERDLSESDQRSSEQSD